MVKNKTRDIRTIKLVNEADHAEADLVQARRTAFVARFIVLREGKRTRAHRRIEELHWEESTTAEQLADIIRSIFVENGDTMSYVDRDIRRALAHASRSISFFIAEYVARATTNFIDALVDYEASNQLLFGADEQPRPGGWRLPAELKLEQERAKRKEAEGGQDET